MAERNSIETVRHFRTVSFLFIFITFLLTGCNSYSKEEKKSEPVVRERNCQREYDQLSSKKFCDINDAIRAANDFLSYFEDKGECSDCCSNVRRIKDDFSSMENLFSNIDERDASYRLCAYYQMVEQNNDRFSNNSFETVRETWKCLTDTKKDKYMRERLNSISTSDFAPHLRQYARDLAEEWYGGGGPAGWVVEDCYILNNEISEPEFVEGKAAKRCSCTIHVKMEGAMGLGLRSGSVDIEVEGTLGLTDNCSLVFSKGNYIKKTVEGGLERRDNIF